MDGGRKRLGGTGTTWRKKALGLRWGSIERSSTRSACHRSWMCRCASEADMNTSVPAATPAAALAPDTVPAAAPSAAHGPGLGVQLLAASLCVLQLAASVVLLVGHLVEHLPPTLERRWTDVRRRAAHLAAVAPGPGGGGLLGESGLLGALAACLPRPTSNADAPTRRAEGGGGGGGGGFGKRAALGRLLTTPAPVQRWRATAARVVAHLCTGRVRARDGYPAGRTWGLALQACSGAPPMH